MYQPSAEDASHIKEVVLVEILELGTCHIIYLGFFNEFDYGLNYVCLSVEFVDWIQGLGTSGMNMSTFLDRNTFPMYDYRTYCVISVLSIRLVSPLSRMQLSANFSLRFALSL